MPSRHRRRIAVGPRIRHSLPSTFHDRCTSVANPVVPYTHRAQSTIRHFVVVGLHVARKLTVSVSPRLSKLFLCDSDQPIDCAMGVCQAVITSSRQSSHRTVTYLIVRSRRTGWIATLEMVFPEFYIQYKQGHYSVNNIRKSSIEIKSQPREGQERNRWNLSFWIMRYSSSKSQTTSSLSTMKF